MNVILLEDIKNLGKRFEIKKAKDGFARNFLFPKKLAIPATKENLSRVRELKKKEEAIVNKLKEKAKEIEKLSLDFVLKKGEKGEIYGSVSAQDIKHRLKEKGIEYKDIELKTPVKEEGEYEVKIDLGKGVKANLKVIIHLQL